MALDPDDPALDFDVAELTGRMLWLSDAERREVHRFVMTAVPQPLDAALQLATLVVAALTTLRRDGTDPVAQALLAIAEELGRRMLVVLE